MFPFGIGLLGGLELNLAHEDIRLPLMDIFIRDIQKPQTRANGMHITIRIEALYSFYVLVDTKLINPIKSAPQDQQSKASADTSSCLNDHLDHVAKR